MICSSMRTISGRIGSSPFLGAFILACLVFSAPQTFAAYPPTEVGESGCAICGVSVQADTAVKAAANACGMLGSEAANRGIRGQDGQRNTGAARGQGEGTQIDAARIGSTARADPLIRGASSRQAQPGCTGERDQPGGNNERRAGARNQPCGYVWPNYSPGVERTADPSRCRYDPVTTLEAALEEANPEQMEELLAMQRDADVYEQIGDASMQNEMGDPVGTLENALQ